MAEAVVEDRPGATQRFYCHVCNREFNNITTNYTCPECSGGFIEELDPAGVTSSTASSTAASANVDLVDSGDSSDSDSNMGMDAPRESLRPLRRQRGQLQGLNQTGRQSGSSTLPNTGRNGTAPRTITPSDAISVPGQSNYYGPTFYNTYDNFIRDFFISVTGGLGVPGTTASGGGISIGGAGGGIAAGGGSGGGAGRPVFNIRPGQIGLGAMTPMFFIGNPGDYAWGHDGLDSVITLLLNQMETTGPPPMSAQKIQDIPKCEIQPEEIEKKLQCSVCLEDFQLNEQCRKLACAHIFHENCIIPWLELHGTCPICRDTFTGPQAEGDGSQSEPMDTSSAGNVASNTLFSNLSRHFDFEELMSHQGSDEGSSTAMRTNAAIPTPPMWDMSNSADDADVEEDDEESMGGESNIRDNTSSVASPSQQQQQQGEEQHSAEGSSTAPTGRSSRTNNATNSNNSNSNRLNFHLDDVLD